MNFAVKGVETPFLELPIFASIIAFLFLGNGHKQSRICLRKKPKYSL